MPGCLQVPNLEICLTWLQHFYRTFCWWQDLAHISIAGELEVLHLEAEARQDRERAQKELSFKESERNKFLSTHERTIISHLGEMPKPGEHSRALSKHLAEKKREASEQGAKLNEKQRSVTKVCYVILKDTEQVFAAISKVLKYGII